MDLILVARKTDELESLARDLKCVVHCRLGRLPVILLDLSFSEACHFLARERPLDLAFLAWGVSGDDQELKSNLRMCPMIHENLYPRRSCAHC